MGIEKRLEAAARKLEGVFQEAAGELTGNRVTRAKGQMKQEQADATHHVENLKDKMKRFIDRF